MAHENAISGLPQACGKARRRRAENEPKRNQAIHGRDGHICDISKAELIPAEQKAQDIPLSAEKQTHILAQPEWRPLL